MIQIDFQHQWRLNIWCGIVNGYLIGPFFFRSTVNDRRYLRFLQNKLPTLLQYIDLHTRQRMWFQHDDAPPHYERNVRTYLDQIFLNRWIGCERPMFWPPRSPDFSSINFYLWGFTKNAIYARQPTTRNDMKNRIRRVCRNILREVLLRTVENFKNRIRLCARSQGNVFEHLING